MSEDKTSSKEAFVRNNLPELCEEVLEWHDTGILREGLLRKLASEHFSVYAPSELALAELLVTELAMRVVVFEHKK